MNHCLSLGFICSFLLISLAGFCIADEVPRYLVYVQGGESSITNGTDGAYEITMKDITPYFHITDEKKSNLVPIEVLSNLTYPMNAALVLSSVDNETTVLVQVANMSLSDGNKVLTFQTEPLEFYEGKLLKSFNENKQDYTLPNEQFARAAVYLESVKAAPENDAHCWPGLCWLGGDSCGSCH